MLLTVGWGGWLLHEELDSGKHKLVHVHQVGYDTANDRLWRQIGNAKWLAFNSVIWIEAYWIATDFVVRQTVLQSMGNHNTETHCQDDDAHKNCPMKDHSFFIVVVGVNTGQPVLNDAYSGFWRPWRSPAFGMVALPIWWLDASSYFIRRFEIRL